MTLTIKLDGNWSRFQLANISVTDSVIAPSARHLLPAVAHLGPTQDIPLLFLSLLPSTIFHCPTSQPPSHAGNSWSIKLRKNCESHIDASHSRQSLVKGERLVRYEVNAVMIWLLKAACLWSCIFACVCSHSLCIQLPWPTLRYLVSIFIFLLPHRVCCHWLSAMPAQHMKAPEQAREDTSPAKIDVTSKSPVGDIPVVTLIRTDATLDHS